MTLLRIAVFAELALVRAAARAALALQGWEALAEDAVGADALVRRLEHLRPDVALLEPFPEDEGLRELPARLRAADPPVRLLLLLGRASPDELVNLLEHGFHGALAKDSLGDELVLAVDAVLRGVRFLSPALSGHVLPRRAEGAS